MSKLAFMEELTGWSITDSEFGMEWWDGGRLEQAIDGWVFLPSGYSLTLPELDQIRHKLANLEATRLAKIELNQLEEKDK